MNKLFIMLGRRSGKNWSVLKKEIDMFEGLISDEDSTSVTGGYPSPDGKGWNGYVNGRYLWFESKEDYINYISGKTKVVVVKEKGDN